MLKKIIALILVLISILSFTACSAPTPSAPSSTQMPLSAENNLSTPPTKEEIIYPEYPAETVLLSELNGYTIVYPAAYDEHRMEEVYILRDTIKDILGFELEIKSDAEEATGKKIILASSVTENGVSDTIQLFQSGFDYVIGTLNGNIILGGNNFYADMRAVYDFINNYLGYNDIDKVVTAEPKTDITGVNLKIHQEPLMTFLGSNFSVSPFTEQYAIRDMADAGFNMTLIEVGMYNEDQYRDFIKWCSRCEIKFMMRGMPDFSFKYTDCPAIWGHVVWDEPKVEKLAEVSAECDKYLAEYGKYGWKPFVNFAAFTVGVDVEYNTPYFESVPVVSVDRYFGNNVFDHPFRSNAGMFASFELYSAIAQRKNQDFWFYIETYNNKNWGINTHKSLRWSSYIGMSFGATGISYFQYGDCSPNYSAEGDWSNGAIINYDYTKNAAWYDAKQNNEELTKLASTFLQYEHMFAYTLNVHNPSDKEVSIMQGAYSQFDTVLEEIQDKTTRYLVGTFKEKYGDGNAFTLVNLESITADEYKSDETTVKVKINGENVKFYLDGELQNISKDINGYYDVPMGNGYCWFITVE